MKRNFPKRALGQIHISKTVAQSIAIIFLIVSLLTIFISTFLYKQFYKQTYRIIGENMQEHLNQNSAQLNLIKEQVYAMGLYVQNDPDLQQYTLSEQNDPVDNYMVVRKLENLVYTNQIIDSIYLYNESTNEIISNYGLLSSTPYDNNILSFLEEYSQSDMLQSEFLLRTVESDSVMAPPRQIFTAIFTQSNSSGIPLLSSGWKIMINVLAEDISRTISASEPYAFTNTVLLDKNGTMLLNTLDNLLEEDKETDSYRDYIQTDSDSGYMTATLNSGKYFLTYYKMPFFGWTLLNLAPMENTLSTLTLMRTMVYGLCAAFILLGLLVAVSVSYRLYRPYQQLAQNAASQYITDDQYIYDAAALISDSMSQIKQQNQSLTESLNLSILLAQKRFLADLVFHRRTDFQDPKKEFENLHIPYYDALNAIVFLQYNEEAETELYSSIASSLNALVKDQFSFFHIELIQLDSETGFLKYLLFILEDNTSLPDICRTIQTAVYEQLQRQISWVIGNTVPDIFSIHESYSNCTELCPYLFLYGKNAVITEESICLTSRLSNCDIENEREAFLNSIRSQNKEALASALNLIFTKIENCTYDLVRLILNHLLLDFITCSNKLLMEFEDTLSFVNMYQNLNNIPTLEETSLFFQLMGNAVIDKLNAQSQNRTVLLIRDVKNYIDEHYASTELCCEFLSQRVHLTPGYLGKLFSETAKISITEYINEVRLLNASKMLLETDTKIVEISSLCGFLNRTYFTSLFKEKYGMSPKVFRSTFRH